MTREDLVLSVRKFKRYKPLLHELVMRDLRVKYRRSFLGYLWSLLNPLMMMAVMSVVFSYMFRFDIPNYPLHLICGQTIWTFFATATTEALISVWGNGALIRKVYIPKYIFPLARVLSNFVTLTFSLAAIVIVMLVTRVPFTWKLLLTVYPLITLMIFSVGLSLILSSLSVYFRDVVHIYSVVTMAWMYLTPIFYPLSALPPQLIKIVELNPMHQYVDCFRQLVVTATIPSAFCWIYCTVAAVVMLGLGLFTFNKLQKNFILYV